MSQQTASRLSSHLIDFVAIDAGNRDIKFTGRNGRPHKIPSYVKQLEPSHGSVRSNRFSVLVTVDGNRYAIGEKAKTLGGAPTFLDNKSKIANLLILPAIEPFPGSELPIVINKLILTLPDSRNPENMAFLKSLEGTKTIIREGVEVTFTINKVVIVDECYGAYKFAIEKNLYQKPGRINGIIDIGGGTSLAKLFMPDGDMIAPASVKLPGTDGLAKAIAFLLVPRLGYEPALDLIMDGIGDRTYDLGETGNNFKAEFLKALEPWSEDIRKMIRAKWHPFYDRLSEVLITGGSAPLVKSFEEQTKGRFKVIANHVFASVNGMAIIGGEND